MNELTYTQKLLQDYLKSTFKSRPSEKEATEVSLAFLAGIETCFRATDAIVETQQKITVSPDHRYSIAKQHLLNFRAEVRQLANSIMKD